MPLLDVVDIARLFLFVREHGNNDGVWVSTIQHLTGNAPPDSWCASFVSIVMGLFFAGASPLPRTASTLEMLTAARAKGWATDTPSVGDLFFYTHPDGTPHHVGIVTALSPLTGIAGNTSADGLSNNGDRVAEHAIQNTPGTITFVAYPRNTP